MGLPGRLEVVRIVCFGRMNVDWWWLYDGDTG